MIKSQKQTNFRTAYISSYETSSGPRLILPMAPRKSHKTKYRLFYFFFAFYYQFFSTVSKGYFSTCYFVNKRSLITFRNWGTCLKFGPVQSPLSGSAIDEVLTFRRFFFTRDTCETPSHPTLEQACETVGHLIAGYLDMFRWLPVSIFKLSNTLKRYF